MKYTSEIVEMLCDHIKQGRTFKDAALLCDITETTFQRWKNDPDKSEFSASIKKAEAVFRKQLEVRIQKASDTTWQAAAWLLERRWKDVYSLRNEITGKDGESLTQISIEITTKSDTSLSKDE